jgi:predicted nuclease of predicted toxin-antitoxin system
MKLLVDACAGGKLTAGLRSAGHDVDFAGDWPTTAEDEQILEKVRLQERIVITRDKDFWTLSVRDKLPHCGVVRLVELPPQRELELCLSALQRHASDLARGALITIEAHRIRVREPE